VWFFFLKNIVNKYFFFWFFFFSGWGGGGGGGVSETLISTHRTSQKTITSAPKYSDLQQHYSTVRHVYCSTHWKRETGAVTKHAGSQDSAVGM